MTLNFLSTAKEGSDDDAFKDLLLQKPEVAMVVVVNVAVENPLLQPFAPFYHG